MLELPQENNRNNKLKTFSIEALEPPNIDHTGLFLFGRKQHCEVTVRCSPLSEDFLIPIPEKIKLKKSLYKKGTMLINS